MPAPSDSMTSQLERTSNILGEYMLKGWTLTDLHCDTCNVTPLMREPAAQASAANRARIQFCAQCDGGPSGQAQQRETTPPLPSTLPQLDFPSPIDPHPPISSSSSARSLSVRERPPSAPPTRPLPTTPLSPDSNLPPISTGTTSRLSPAAPSQPLPRATSPTAAQRTRTSEEISELISQRLLQGWSLLQSSCPNPRCEGIPLIGYPRAKVGTRDPRRMCVGCGTGYVLEGAMGGLRPVRAAGAGVATSGGAAAAPVPAAAGPSGAGGLGLVGKSVPESPRSKRRRELYETGEAINKTLRPAVDEVPSTSQFTPNPPAPLSAEDEDKDLYTPLDNLPAEQAQSVDSLTSALANVNTSLARTLDRLATSLTNHTAGPDPSGDARYFIDVKLHTEAIRDVLECVERVRRVQ